jgi:hypothetical protein
MFKMLLKIKSLFAEKPSSKLTWTVKDYEKGRNWSKTQPHPFIKNKTLWDLCYDKADSANTIHNLNKFLFNEI